MANWLGQAGANPSQNGASSQEKFKQRCWPITKKALGLKAIGYLFGC